MEIYKATQKDLPEILALQKSCYLDEAEIYDDYQIPPLTQTLASMEEDFEKEVFLKITSENKIIASVRAYGDAGTCKIGKLIVQKEFRNNGLGRKLMKTIESQFDHVKRFELFTGNKSVKNLSLYGKLGYTEFKRQFINKNLALVFLEKININL